MLEAAFHGQICNQKRKLVRHTGRSLSAWCSLIRLSDTAASKASSCGVRFTVAIAILCGIRHQDSAASPKCGRSGLR